MYSGILLGAQSILHISRIRVKNEELPYPYSYMYTFGVNLTGKALIFHTKTNLLMPLK
jgi:hypothetical protein